MRECREQVEEDAQPNEPGTRQSSALTDGRQDTNVRDEEHPPGGRHRPLWIGQQPLGRDLLSQQSQDQQPAPANAEPGKLTWSAASPEPERDPGDDADQQKDEHSSAVLTGARRPTSGRHGQGSPAVPLRTIAPRAIPTHTRRAACRWRITRL